MKEAKAELSAVLWTVAVIVLAGNEGDNVNEPYKHQKEENI